MDLLNVNPDLFSEAEVDAETGSVVTGLREIGVHWHDPLAPALTARVVVRGWQGSPYAVFSLHGFLQPNPAWQLGSMEPRQIRHHLALMVQVNPRASQKAQILAEAVAARAAARLTNAPREIVERMLTRSLATDDTANRVEATLAALAERVEAAEKTGDARLATAVANIVAERTDTLKAKFSAANELGVRRLVTESEAIDDAGRVVGGTRVQIPAVTYSWPYTHSYHSGYLNAAETAAALAGTQSPG